MQLCRRRISKIWIHSTSQTERDESKIFSTDVPELWTIIGQTFANLTYVKISEYSMESMRKYFFFFLPQITTIELHKCKFSSIFPSKIVSNRNIIFNECTVLLFLALHGSFSSVTYVDCQAEEQQKTDQVIAMLDQMNINLGPGGRSLVDRFLIGSPQVVHFKQVVNPPLNFVYDPDYSRNTIENTENYRKFREM